MSAKETLIKVENLQKYYKGGAIKALDGINTEIKKGEVVVVIGPSGSGKSTFLRCLNLLEVPTGGHILFEGTDITDEKTNINVHRQKMGMVFQHFNLFPHMTILKNMTIAPMKLLKKSEAEATEKAMELLKRVGLEDRANAYPSQLSGGQKQRIAIVPYIFAYSPAMLFDNVSSAFEVVQIVVSALIGLFGVAAALNGFVYKKIPMLFRLAMAAGGLCMMIPGTASDVVGLVMVGGIVLIQRMSARRLAA